MNKIEDYTQISGVWRTVHYDLSKTADIARYLVRNPYAWPGGYALFGVTDDGGVLCPKCIRENYRAILESLPGDGWHLTGIGNAEELESSNYCDHCYIELTEL